MREAGADGYALFERGTDGALSRLDGGGRWIGEENVAGGPGLKVACFPLRVGGERTGVLAFGFEGHALTLAAKSRLCRVAAAIEQVWQLAGASKNLAGLATRIAELETELADAKIATRARGFLENPGGRHDVVDTVARHVQNVLRPFESSALLEKRRQELEAELEERTLTTKAKSVLQAAEGLSEDAAHLRLRLLSRKTRRPLRDVALDVIHAAR
jgi:hypothetical protein